MAHSWRQPTIKHIPILGLPLGLYPLNLCGRPVSSHEASHEAFEDVSAVNGSSTGLASTTLPNGYDGLPPLIICPIPGPPGDPGRNLLNQPITPTTAQGKRQNAVISALNTHSNALPIAAKIA